LSASGHDTGGFSKFAKLVLLLFREIRSRKSKFIGFSFSAEPEVQSKKRERKMADQISTQGGAAVSNSTVNAGIVQFGSSSTIVQNNYLPPVERACPSPPMPPDRFGGRNTVYEDFLNRLKTGTVALHAIVGEGGIGKTILAQKLAYDFYHGNPKNCKAVLWSEVSPQPDPTRLLREWAYKADPNFKAPENESLPQLAARVRDLLEELVTKECAECEPPRVLVVLDAVWENGLETVNLLRQACPANSLVIMTTRSKEISVNAGAMRLPLNKLTAEEGADLLKLYLPWADAEKLRALAMLLDGVPLAMKLAATKIELQDDPTTALEIELQKTGLESLSGDPDQPTPKDSVADALNLSYKALSPEEQVAFRTMGVLAQALPFDLNLLAAIWHTDEAKTRTYSEKLQKMSLLEADKDVAVPGWFRLQPLLHEYAQNLLHQSGEFEATLTRYLEFSLPLTDNFQKLPPEDWRQLEPYMPHINFAGLLLAEAIKNPNAPKEILEGVVLFAQNISYYTDLRYDPHKLLWYEMGIAASRKLNDPANEVILLNGFGFAHLTNGNLQEAEKLYQEAKQVAEINQDTGGKAHSLNNLGWLYALTNRHEEAINVCNEALILFEQIEDLHGQASTLRNLSALFSQVGQTEAALEALEGVLKFHREDNDRNGEAHALNNIGDNYREIADFEQAQTYFEAALKAWQEIGDRNGEALTLSNVALIEKELQQYDQALAHLQECLNIYQTLNLKPDLAYVYVELAKVLVAKGDFEAVDTYLEQARPLYEGLKDAKGLADLDFVGGQKLVAQGNHEAGYKLLEKALHSYTGQKDLRAVGDTIMEIGRLLVAIQKYEDALKAFEEARNIYTSMFAKFKEAQATQAIGEVLALKGAEAEALTELKKAKKLYKEVGSPKAEEVAAQIKEKQAKGRGEGVKDR
jgi:tetratricopeptide (TPR) repeat protein